MRTLDINILLLMMIAGAVIAIEMRDYLSCIVAIGLVGLAQSLAFLVLKAPDLAIVQLVVEILSLVILLRVTIHKGELEPERRIDVFPLLCGVALPVLILVLMYGAIRELPAFGAPLMRVARHYVENGLAETGAANLVSGVILDYRAYDTLGEAVVLFTAVCGVVAVMRRMGRKKEGVQGAEE
jgi:multicomponent Na+:H+ antiporter subunit B